MSNKKAPGGRGQETREIEVDAAKYAAFPGRGQGGLDACRRFRHAGGPLTLRGVASAFPASQGPGKVLLTHYFFLLSKRLPHIRAAGGLHILAGHNVQYPRGLAASRRPGSVAPCLFYSPNFERPLCFFFPYRRCGHERASE